MGKLTVTYNETARTTIKNIQSSITATAPTIASTALTSTTVSFTESGVTGSQTVNSTGLTSPGVTSISSGGGYTTYLGGTTFSYSRFGLTTYTSVNTSDAKILEDRIAPFYVSTVYPSFTPTTATYVGKLTGNITVDSALLRFVVCDVSIAYTVTGSTSVMTPTVSKCVNAADSNALVGGGVVSGSLTNSTTGTASTFSPGSTALNYTDTGGNTITVDNVTTLAYFIGGPNGEELVGSGNAKDTLAGSGKTGIFSFSFGGKKQ